MMMMTNSLVVVVVAVVALCQSPINTPARTLIITTASQRSSK